MEAGYKKLIVWQKAMDLVVLVYKLTDSFPKNELYGLTSQVRRAAVSIPSNIAEGSRKRTERDRANFLSIAFGSASELETQLEIAKRISYLSDDNFKNLNNLLVEVLKMLNKMINYQV